MIEPLELLTNIFNAALTVYTFYLFVAYFADKRFNKWLHYSLLVFSGIALSCILSFTQPGVVRTLFVGMVALMVSLLFKMRWYNYFLVAISEFSTLGVLELITTVLLSVVFSVDTQSATEGVFKIVGIVLSKMFVLLVLAIMRIFKYRFSYSLSLKRALTLLLIPSSTMVISLLHINLFVKFPAQSQALVYSSLLSYIVLVFSNVVVFYLIDNSYKESEKEKQVIVLTELLQAQTKQYELMQAHNREVMKIRHDHKNFLIGIISELEGGNIEFAKGLLEGQLDVLKRPDRFDFNDIVSAVVKTKSDHANRVGVEIDFEYSGLHKIQISSVDLAIILGSALDNAIEAAQNVTDREKRVRTVVKVNHDLLVIVIKNPTEKQICVSRPISTKRNNGAFGFGIVGIEELAKKYGGEAIFRCDDLTFETNIILRNVNE